MVICPSFLAMLSNAGWREAAANTVSFSFADAAPWPAVADPPQAARTSAATRAAARALCTRQLYVHVRRFDDRHRGHSGLEVEVIGGVTGDQRDETVRAGLDLDLGRDLVFDDAGDDAGEAVAGRLPDRGFATVLASRLRYGRERLAVDHALPALGAHRDEAAVVDHPADGIDADT